MATKFYKSVAVIIMLLFSQAWLKGSSCMTITVGRAERQAERE